MDGNQERTWPGAEQLLFLGRFLRSPRTVGAIAPSSRYLARAMVAVVDFRPGVKVVELGPGTGPFTALIDRLLPPEGRYLGIEREPEFVEMLRRRLPRLEYACDSVVNLVELARERGLLPIDHLVSGLPFASLPAATTLPVLDAVAACLGPGGTFTTFQYLHAYPLASARRFRKEMTLRLGPSSRRTLVTRNLPPAFALTWRKVS